MKVHDVVFLEPYEKEELPPLKELLGDFAHAMSKDNITMAAMQEYFTGKRTGSYFSNFILFRFQIQQCYFSYDFLCACSTGICSSG